MPVFDETLLKLCAPAGRGRQNFSGVIFVGDRSKSGAGISGRPAHGWTLVG